MTQNTNPVTIAADGRLKIENLVREAIRKHGVACRTEQIREHVRTSGVTIGNDPLQEIIAEVRGSKVATPKTKRAKLTDYDKFRLMTWLETNRDRIRNQRMTKADTVLHAAKELKFGPEVTLTDDMIEHAAKHFGIEFRRRAKLAGAAAVSPRLKAIEDYLVALGGQLNVPFTPSTPEPDDESA